MMEEISLELARRKLNGIRSWGAQHEITQCGKSGKRYEHRETRKNRFIGNYCNQRRFHIPCAITYRNGQGIEMKAQYQQIMKAQKLWGLYYWIFTFPEEVQTWIDANDDQAKAILGDIRKAIATTIRRAFDIGPKSRNVQPGFSIIYHPVSSSDPFKPFAHFHVIALPITANLKENTVKVLGTRFDHRILKVAYKRELDEVLEKWGLWEFKKDVYNVHLHDVEEWQEGKINHVFKYNNRSQAEDILKIIKRVSDDFQHFVCVRHDKKNDCLIPELKTRADMLSAFEKALNPVIQSKMSYGFMRTIQKYSDLLRIIPDDWKMNDDFEEKEDVEFLRMARARYKEGKVRTVVERYWRVKGSDDEWKMIDPGEIMGELARMSGRRLWKAIDTS